MQLIMACILHKFTKHKFGAMILIVMYLFPTNRKLFWRLRNFICLCLCCSGGNILTVTGTYLDSVYAPKMLVHTMMNGYYDEPGPYKVEPTVSDEERNMADVYSIQV